MSGAPEVRGLTRTRHTTRTERPRNLPSHSEMQFHRRQARDDHRAYQDQPGASMDNGYNEDYMDRQVNFARRDRRVPGGRGEQRRESLPPTNVRTPLPRLQIPPSGPQTSYFSPFSSNASSGRRADTQYPAARHNPQVSRFSNTTPSTSQHTGDRSAGPAPSNFSFSSTPRTGRVTNQAVRYDHGVPTTLRDGHWPVLLQDAQPQTNNVRRNSASSEEGEPQQQRHYRETFPRNPQYRQSGGQF